MNKSRITGQDGWRYLKLHENHSLREIAEKYFGVSTDTMYRHFPEFAKTTKRSIEDFYDRPHKKHVFSVKTQTKRAASVSEIIEECDSLIRDNNDLLRKNKQFLRSVEKIIRERDPEIE